MSLDPKERFTAAADLYQRFRPSYPGALLDWIASSSGLGAGAAVADVGCGTGIFTRLLASRGYDAIGVDPNEAMLSLAASSGPGIYRRGEAEATGLPAASVRLVTVAQAFHWFRTEPTLSEFSRILVPGGHCAAFWNIRSLETRFMEEYDALLKSSSEEYSVLESHERTIDQLLGERRVLGAERAEFPNAQRLDEPGFFGRVFSSSYVLHGVRDRSSFEGSLKELFGKHRDKGTVELSYRCVGLCFRIGPP